MKNPQLLILLALRHNTKYPLQSFLLILGVALGVAIIVGTEIANESATKAFNLSVDTITGRATHQIVAGTGGIPTSFYEMLRLELGFREVAPVVTGQVLLKEADNLRLQLLGIDPAAELPFRNYTGDRTGRISISTLALLLLDPNGIVLSRALSERYKLAVGDTLTVNIGGQSKQVRLVGLLQTSDNTSRQALDGFLFSDISVAQELLDKVGQIDHIDIILPSETNLQPIIDRLPPNARLQPVNLRTQAIEQIIASIEQALSFWSWSVLIVGIFLIYNTISFSVVRQRSVLGVLRCLGMTRQEVLVLVLFEALILGMIGTIIGLGFGLGLGQGIVRLVTQTIEDGYYKLTVQSVVISPTTLYKGTLTGLFASLLAALIPAIEATTISPYNTLRHSEQEARIWKVMPYLTIGGVLLQTLGWTLLLYPTKSQLIFFIAILLLTGGYILLVPLITQLLMRIIQPMTRWSLGFVGIMGPRDIVRSLSRTSVAITALMLAITTVVGISLMIDSFRNTVVTWLEDVIEADIYIFSTDQNALSPSLVHDIRQVEGISHISLSRDAIVFSPDYGEVTIRATSPRPNDNKFPLLWSVSSSSETFAALGGDTVMISEAFAHRHNLPLDQPSALRLSTAQGIRTFKIIGIFYDYAAPQLGYILMRLQTYQLHWEDDYISGINLYLTPKLVPQTESIVRRLQSQFVSGKDTLSIVSNRVLKELSLEIFERSFTVTSALRLLAIIVAFISILGTLVSLQLERTHELAIMRANGLTIPQLWGKTLLETALMGFTAGLMAIPASLIYSIILLQIINQMFGFSVQLSLHPIVFVLALTGSVITALLAAIYPVIRLNNMNIATALREG